jgi:hypothetical protein
LVKRHGSHDQRTHNPQKGKGDGVPGYKRSKASAGKYPNGIIKHALTKGGIASFNDRGELPIGPVTIWGRGVSASAKGSRFDLKAEKIGNKTSISVFFDASKAQSMKDKRSLYKAAEETFKTVTGKKPDPVTMGEGVTGTFEPKQLPKDVNQLANLREDWVNDQLAKGNL